MKVLVIGNGGREHALAWKAAQSPLVDTVYVAPGNAGTALEPSLQNVAIGVTDIPALLRFAQDEKIDLTIVGPEAPLVIGVVDAFRAAGLAIFGPTEGAAQLEGSKAFTKDFLARHHIPTAEYQNFTEVEPALAYLREKGAPIVIKADGLAAGKGVIVAMTLEEAEAAVKDMLAGNAFGDAGHRIVIEEFLDGEEASFIVMVDGEHVLPMATSQDHKRVGNGDTGPNTGGMGAYSPAPVVTDEVHQRTMERIIWPTVKGMAAEGNTYTGFLYAGLMIDKQGNPKVIEFNCRFGDPETQPIMLRMKSDLVELCLAACAGKLDEKTSEWDDRASLGVVVAAGGYPGSYNTGDEIYGLPQQEVADGKVFHAGTKLSDDQRVVTNGGRVLFIGTKRQAQEAVAAEAGRAGQFHVTNRWMGGTLTNFATIQKSIERLKKLEAMFADGSVNRYQKKEILTLQREMAKLELTLGGIKDMDRLPQLAFIIDPNREEIAVKECRKLGIPIVAVTDTNCDPDVIDYIIPGNDDAIRAIKLFVTAMAEACLEGEAMRKDSKNKDAEEELKKAADAEAKAEEAPAVEAAAE